IITTIGTFFDNLYKWGITPLILGWINALTLLLSANQSILTIILIAAVIISLILINTLLRKVKYLGQYVALNFEDNFTGNLRKNWDYHGDWEIAANNEVSITNSPFGGITKVGTLWRDYVFEFNAVIENDRIGWIVRAQDTFNYYMIQLTPTVLRPHFLLVG